MEYYYTKIIGTPVYADGQRPITTVRDLEIDPENGKIAAFIVNVNRNLVITPLDVLSWHEVIKINHEDAIISGDEILRLQNIRESGSRIYRNNVVTKDGKYLGKVLDFSIDTKTLTLQKLFVAKEFWGLLRYESRIINYSHILEILPSKIIVKDDMQTVKEEVKGNIKLEDMAVT